MIIDNKVNNQKSFTKKNLVKIAKSKNLIRPKNYGFSSNSRNLSTRSGFFILGAKLAFIKLKQVLIKASILYYFNLEYQI